MSDFVKDLSAARPADVPRSGRGLHRVPFAELRARLGISDADLDAEAKRAADELAQCEAFASHAEFERHRDAEGRTRYADPTDCTGTLRIIDDSGRLWPLCCDACEFEVDVAIERVDPGRILARRLSRCGVPEMFAGKEFEKGDPDQEPTLQACRQWVSHFRPGKVLESVPAIALWGKPGRGKSHLLSLMIETLVRKHGADALYRSERPMFDDLRAGLDTGAFEIRWQRLLHVQVLGIDDVGAGRWTEWEAERFAALVDHRYAKGLPLLIATNIPPAGWDRRFGDRTGSRLRGLCVRLELAGKDRRIREQGSLIEAAA